MRVSYKWLKEYVDVDLPAEELGHRLTMSGLAVENIEDLGKEISNVVVGQIIKIDRHPDADKLSVCTVDVNSEAKLQIVTGATNVREGDKVPVALVGASLPGGVKIKLAKLRGIESQGMLCSAQELNLDMDYLPQEQLEGILILDQDLPLGQNITEVFGLDDVILEFELTPNRGDCLSVINIAREVAAITGAPLKLPRFSVKEEGDGEIDNLAKVTITDPELCGRYIARIFQDIKLGPSPVWMQQRLQAAGVRPINNIVDITNYVMLETGQPLHAFDYDKLANREIIVRRATEGEEITTLDNNKRVLDQEMLVIADAEKPVAVAGVMGGLETEVTETTKTVLLEAAHFHPISVRRTSKKLGLKSESSIRFEKTVNLEGVLDGANRAAQLVEELGVGKVVRGMIDVYPVPAQELVLTLRLSRVNDILGTDLSQPEVKELLARLRFEIQEVDQNSLLVKIPHYRQDITREIDLIEEVARIYGYYRIPLTMPQGAMTRGYKKPDQMARDICTEVLTSCGLTEVISFSFISPRAFDLMNLSVDDRLRQVVEIKNPLSEEQGVMRTSLIPGLLQVIERNRKRRNDHVQIFELGNVFFPSGKDLPDERMTVAAAVIGELPGTWLQRGIKADFFYLKGVIEELFLEFGIKFDLEPFQTHPTFHPGRAGLIKVKGEQLGVIGEIHPDVQENFNLTDRVCVFEIDLSKVIRLSDWQKQYQPLPRFPRVERDLAILVKEDIPAAEIIRGIKKAGGILLTSVSLFDLYQGTQIPQGFRSLAFSLTYQADDRTLTDDEINALQEKIKDYLKEQFGAELR